jgi:cephalosporin hydroxylase
MNEVTKFFAEVATNIAGLKADAHMQKLSRQWMQDSCRHKYTYNFTWLGRPIIQYPQDIIAMQELIWKVKPQLVIETGVAHGGSLVFYASMLELLGGGEVLGIDIDIRAHNRREIENHPLAKRIKLLQGSSIAAEVVAEARRVAQGKQRVMVVLDSNHTHDHVLNELRLYSPFVTRESYLVVCDTGVEDLPANFFPDRPWGPGNNPKTAVHAFLRECDRFEIDRELEGKLLITVAPDGYLKCIRD